MKNSIPFLLSWLFPFLIITGLIALVSGLKALFSRFLTKTFLTPLRAKGEVLKGATITVHEVVKVSEPIEQPEPEEDDEILIPRDWYRLDVTIIPQFKTGAFTLWEPTELVFVPGYTLPGSVPLEKLDDEEPDEIGFVRSVEVWQESGEWKPDDESADGKYDGPQRLRLLIGVDKDTPSVRFRYYFEVFGLIELPSARGE